jgi:hypothetical protein
VIVSLAESFDRKAEPDSNLLGLNCIPFVTGNRLRTARIAWFHGVGTSSRSDIAADGVASPWGKSETF